MFTKMKRDIKNNLVQFISIFVMAFLASFVFSGINSEWYGMKTEAERYYEETNLAHIWIMGNYFSHEDLKKVKNISGIKHASLRLTYDADVSLGSEKTLRINLTEENIISKPELAEGNPIDSGKDGLWLDYSFAKANSLRTGDTIEFGIAGFKMQKEILGLILHPEYIHSSKDGSNLMPDHENFGFAFLFSSVLPQDFDIPYNQILVTLIDDGDVETVTQELETVFSDRFIVILNRDTHPSVSVFKNEIEQNKAVGGIFPVVFFLLAALSMLSTMTRLTNAQRTQIGTLKALGFSKRKILFHYVSYGILIGLTGGVTGLFAGISVIPPILFNMQKSIYTLPEWSIALSPSSFIIIILLTLSCGLSSYFACRGQLKEIPAALLRPKAPKHHIQGSLEKSRFWQRLDFSAQWTLRDIFRSKIRSLMTVIGICGCTSLLLFGFGLRDTVNKVSKFMYEELNVYENKIYVSEAISKESMEVINSSYKGQWIQEADIEMKSGTHKESGILTVLDDGDEIQFMDKNLKPILLPDEGVALSYNMSRVLNVGVGDNIYWRIYGQKDWKESKISAIYRTPMGQGISIKRNEFEMTGETFIPTAFLTSAKDIRQDMPAYVTNIQNKNNLMDNFNELLDSIRMIIAILVLGAVLLGSVILYNLGTLSFSEKSRELATLKVLGFSARQIRSLLSKENIWLAILGIIAGIPLGYLLLHFMLSTMPASLDMIPHVSAISLFISVFGTFILSVIISLYLSRNIRSIDMVSALKSVD